MKPLSLRQRMALELNRRLKEGRRREHPLRQLFWECTWRCNLACRHCGSDCKSSSSLPDMPAEDFLRVIDSLLPHVDRHRLNIVITGGEPLVGSVLLDGGIGACPSIRADYRQGNIYTDDFWDVWQNRFEQYRDRSWMKRGICADCSFWRYCEGNGMHLRDADGNIMHCHLAKRGD